ncbi:TadE/TadG family type IV pilus assembly protein [Alkalibacillus haloalkaliphilus]|uniref:TadE-like domain-containing protein n=1 Tax=Alkalibacillus haloalkaliphilus TaxID=94136 RepID=A0A511W0A5_9BACI|nr:TadE/TadG family type IV pilus assembly protein [Alkalibacillus haloalkaliphilus]GEN44519.1 hypothetical protein AHA02nite_02950 [Alkalibacillus haloalkaliphilus]
MGLRKIKSLVRNDKGSVTIEFLGIIPLVLILLAVLIQFIVGVNGYLVAQSAANEYAKVYSVTQSSTEASSAANRILTSTGDYLEGSVSSLNVTGKNFDADINVSISLIFLPDEILGWSTPSISFTTSAPGRVIE